jgi:uncharacterized protein
MRGSWIEQMAFRVPAAVGMQAVLFLVYSFWRVSSLMLLGMAAYKLGLLSKIMLTRISLKRNLVEWALILMALGWGITLFGVYQNEQHQWEIYFVNLFGSQFNYFGSVIAANGYGLFILAVFSRLPNVIAKPLQAVGRTALSNYILQSILCSLLFYGHGFGLFAHFDRFQQLLIVPMIWVLQCVVSMLWLKHYRHGPLEWVWRCAVTNSYLPLAKSALRSA